MCRIDDRTVGLQRYGLECDSSRVTLGHSKVPSITSTNSPALESVGGTRGRILAAQSKVAIETATQRRVIRVAERCYDDRLTLD